MATNKFKSATPAAQLRAAKKVPLGDGFVLLKIGDANLDAAVKPEDKAEVLVGKAGAALKSPGIARNVVFRGATPQKVFAYSAMPGDSNLIVRESVDGNRTFGKIGADGRFHPSRKLA